MQGFNRLQDSLRRIRADYYIKYSRPGAEARLIFAALHMRGGEVSGILAAISWPIIVIIITHVAHAEVRKTIHHAVLYAL